MKFNEYVRMLLESKSEDTTYNKLVKIFGEEHLKQLNLLVRGMIESSLIDLYDSNKEKYSFLTPESIYSYDIIETLKKEYDETKDLKNSIEIIKSEIFNNIKKHNPSFVKKNEEIIKTDIENIITTKKRTNYIKDNLTNIIRIFSKHS